MKQKASRPLYPLDIYTRNRYIKNDTKFCFTMNNGLFYNVEIVDYH